MLGFNPHATDLKVFHFLNVQMTAAINSREHAEQFKRIETADDADIEQAIVHLGPGSNLHSAAIQRSVGECGQDRGPVAAGNPNRGLRVALSGCKNLHGQWRESENRRSQAERVAAMPA